MTSHHQQQHNGVPPTATPERDVLHRAIYDYFQRLAQPSAAATTNGVGPPEDELPEKARRVMEVLGREFPSILQIPGEQIQQQPQQQSISELEKRFYSYHHQVPPAHVPQQSQQDVPFPPTALATNDNHDDSPFSFSHPAPTPLLTMPVNPPLFHPTNTAETADPSSAAAATPAMAPEAWTFPSSPAPMPPLRPPPQNDPTDAVAGFFNPMEEGTETTANNSQTNANPTTDALTTNKRKASPMDNTDNVNNNKESSDDAQPPGQQSPNATKKLQEQETTIQKMKSQLRQAKKKIKTLHNRVKTNQDEESSNTHRSSSNTTNISITAKDTAGSTASSNNSVTFEQRFQELVHFERGYGHCRVPCTSKENPGLARWVQTLRAAYKEKQKRQSLYTGQLTDERQERLEQIGFEWSIQARPKATWDSRWQDLKQFKEEHGHCRVVRSYAKDPSLGEWCHRQRFLAHKNELEPHKVKKLTDLGFEIWVRKQGKSWDEHFEMLLEFRRKHQHLTVPPPDTRSKAKQILKASTNNQGDNEDGGDAPEDDNNENDATATVENAAEIGPPSLDPATEEYKEEQAFRRWVVMQRDNYHLKYLKGIKSPLTKARVKKLDGLNFNWEREGGENDLRKVRRGELHHRNDPEIWNRRFQELVEYKKRFGDCNVPKEWPENKPLGAWVATQRKGYKAMLAGERSSLNNERRVALENIGFIWILRPGRTRSKILEIEGLQTMATEML